MPRQLSELIEVAVLSLRGLVRVNARRRVNPFVPLGNPDGLAHPIESCGPADGQQILEPRAARPLDHGVAVRVKVGIVEVAVGVDVHSLSVCQYFSLSVFQFLSSLASPVESSETDQLTD